MTRRPYNADAIFADVMVDFGSEPGDGIATLVRAYVDKLAEHDALMNRFDDADAAGKRLEAIRLFRRSQKVFEDAVVLLEQVLFLQKKPTHEWPWLSPDDRYRDE